MARTGLRMHALGLSGRLSHLVRRRSWPVAWGLALAIFLCALVLRFELSPWLDQIPFLTFFPALFACALLCGRLQAAAVLLMSAAASWAFFLPTSPTVDARSDQVIVPLLGFIAVGGVIILFVLALVALARELEAARRYHESLFQELQHRVANNMQFIASMLHQARRGMEGAAAEALDAAAVRIAAMASLNRRLADPAAYALGLEPVLTDLLTETFRDVAVAVIVSVKSRPLSLDQMTAVVLLVSEAATNALKHVFRPQQGSVFEVSLRESRDGRLALTIRDDGPGLGADPLAAPPARRLGMRIMQALANQLGGSLQLPEGAGATLLVEFGAD